MSNGINSVLVGGNIGSDVELRVTQSGVSILNLSIACNDTYLDRNRQRQETVEWVRVVVFGKRAEGLAKFLRKGSWILVEGSLKTSKWTDREGIDRWKTEVVAKNVYLGGGSNSQRGNQQRERRQGRDPERRGASLDEGGQNDYGGSYDNGEPGGDRNGSGGSYDDYGSGGGDDDIPFVFVTSGTREPWWRW